MDSVETRQGDSSSTNRDSETLLVSSSVQPKASAQLAAKSFDYRSLFWKWHLYAGLFGGPLLILIAMTGAILVFSPEIDQWLRPDLWRIAPPVDGTVKLSEQAIVDAVFRSYPDEKVLFYKQSHRQEIPYQFLLVNPSAYKGIRDVWISPYTGQVNGDRMRESSFVRIVEQLHRRLLKDEIGSSIVEVMTGWGIVLMLTGAFLWWPKTVRGIRKALSLTFRGSLFKINWKLHNTIGAWVGLVVLLMCLTGMVFSTYSGLMYRTVMERTGGSNLTGVQGAKSNVIAGQDPLAVDELINHARSELASSGKNLADIALTVQFPRESTGCVVITTTRDERPGWEERNGYRSWTFDQFSGEVLGRSTWDQLHPMMQFWFFSLSLHYGSIFGLPTKLIALFACLSVPVLSVTGYLIWWWKRKGQQKAKNSRRANQTGSRNHQPISKPLIAALFVVGIIFPTIGVSFLILCLWEWLRFKFRRRLANP